MQHGNSGAYTVVQVHVGQTQTFQRLIDRLVNVLWLIANTLLARLRVLVAGELGCLGI